MDREAMDDESSNPAAFEAGVLAFSGGYATQYQSVHPKVVRSVRKNVVVVCNDVVGHKMAGPAIRCVEICKALSASFNVLLAAPKVDASLELPFQICLTQAPEFRAAALSAHVLIFQGDALRTHPFLKTCNGALIADLYCPIPLEYHQSSEGLPPGVRNDTIAYLSDMLLEQLAYADHFLCASEKQRDYWLGALTLAARVNPQRWPSACRANVSDLISLLPFGLDAREPLREGLALREKFSIPKDDFVMVWGGGIYQWFDPLTIIAALQRLVTQGFRAHLVFIGVKHPNPGISEHDMCGRAVQVARDCGLLDRYVHFNFGWVDYAERHRFLLDADIGVSAHFDNPETRFAFRTRMLDYLWCHLPIVATKGDVFGDALERVGAGIAVDYEDVTGWEYAIERLIMDRGLLDDLRQGAASYSTQFQWSAVTEPLCQLCHSITPSPDRVFVRDVYSARGVRSSLARRVRHAYAKGGAGSVLRGALRRVANVLR